MHATKKKSAAQLDREIAAFLQSRAHTPHMPHAIPDRGYMVAQRGGPYLSSFGSKDEAERFARGLAKQTRETYDIVKVQNRGEDRSVVGEISLPTAKALPPRRRSHATKKTAGVGDEVYAISGGRRHGPGTVEEIYDDGSMRVDFTRQFAGRLRVRPEDLISVPKSAQKIRSHATRRSEPRDWTARQMTSGRRVVEKARGSKIARIFQGEGHWTVTINRREPREPFETTGEITRQSAKTLAAAKSLGTRLLKG